jgi:PTS system cellobiose-specific IIC component
VQEKLRIHGEKFTAWTQLISENKYIRAVRHGLIFSIPALVIGSFAILLLELPLENYRLFMFRVFGHDWYRLASFVIEATNQSLALFFLLGVSYDLADAHERNSVIGVGRYKSFVAILVAVACYTIFATIQLEDIFLFKNDTDGVFLAILIAIASTEIFCRISSIKRLQFNFHSDTTNPAVSKVFETLGSAVITILIFSFLRTLLAHFGITARDNISELLIMIFQNDMTTGLLSSLVFTFVRGVLMVFGIFSSGALSSVMQTVYRPADNANYQAHLIGLDSPYIITESFLYSFVFIGGVGATIGLVLGALFIRKRNNMYRLAQISLVPALFNINQIIIYGLPVIFNPIFVIPFVMTPVVLLLTSYIAVASGLVAPAIYTVSTYMPPLLSGYLVTHSYSGVFLQLFNIIVSVGIYFPFLILHERLRERDFEKSKTQLIYSTQNRFVVEEHYLTYRNDGIGGAARVLSADLRQAIRQRELYLQYQPKVDIKSQTIIGVEALVRWRHTEYGNIPPPVIIALAEEGGFIDDLGFWIINEAASCLRGWREKGLTRISMAINLSAYELNDLRIVYKIAETLVKYEIPAHLFEVEITENMELSVNKKVVRTLDKLLTLKVPLTIDDFGMGYSSAVYLKHFPISTLKIDRVLSVDAVKDKKSEAILTSIINMCNQLNIKVVVEYVETHEQLEALIEKGCHIFQGYLFSRPLDEKDAYTYMAETELQGKLIYSKPPQG